MSWPDVVAVAAAGLSSDILSKDSATVALESFESTGSVLVSPAAAVGLAGEVKGLQFAAASVLILSTPCAKDE